MWMIAKTENLMIDLHDPLLPGTWHVLPCAFRNELN
jgi:hypothetical protein